MFCIYNLNLSQIYFAVFISYSKTHKENEIIKGNFEHNNYIDPRSQGNKDSYASNLAIIDLDTEDIE